MLKLTSLTFALALAACATAASEPPLVGALTTEPYVFESGAGERVEAEHGWFQVRENRNDPSSRLITLHYVRFPATTPNPGAPIVYLAGGPGGAATGAARGERFALFMALRQAADVIAFDQRGTGLSDRAPACTSRQTLSLDQPFTREITAPLMIRAVTECAAFWRQQGVDLAGYNTAESARDLDDLRRHLGADRISLWGISYGTHLALAALKEMPDHIDRIALSSVEGLDQTVKSPAETEAYFTSLQAAIDADPALQARYPDVRDLIERVLTRIRANPPSVPLGEGASLTIGDLEVQLLVGAGIIDPPQIIRLLPLFEAADQGEYTPLAGVLFQYVRERSDAIKFEAMPLAMDLASGISDERFARIEREALTSPLGDALNYPMPHLRDALPDLDLGEAFRAAPRSDRPTLILTGTLDGRTYPAEQRAAVAGLTNRIDIAVQGGGHNLYALDPRIDAAVVAFFRGEPLQSQTIALERPFGTE